MKSLRLPVAATGVVALLGGISFYQAQRDSSVFAEEAPAPTETLARADEISSGFRWVAKKTLPSVVSIRSVKNGQRVEMTQLNELPGSPFDGSSLEELFGQLGGRMIPPRGDRSPDVSTGQGSGFIFSKDGLIMTNAHVVRGADEVTITLQDGKEYEAQDIKVDEFADVAVLKIDAGRSLPALPLGDDSQLEIGDWALAFGSPFGLDQTITQGIISAKSRGLKDLPSRQEFLQTDAAINPGNSGGPLVNIRGEVVGINTAIETRSGGYDGVGFAVPISLARWVSDQLVQNGKVRRAYLGVKLAELTSGISRSLDLPTSKGVIVAEVTKSSPAEKAGIKVEDVILKLNNRDVASRQQLMTVAERMEIGRSYPLVVLRDGSEVTLDVVAGEFPESIAMAQSGGDIRGLGIEVQALTPELAAELDIQTDTGVVVTNVERGGIADRIGIRAGHVIARIGKTDIASVEDLEKALEIAKERRQLVLLIKSANGTQLLSVPFSGEE